MGDLVCNFITGNAGTGKTFSQKELIRQNPKHAILAATTGIAAVNLGTVTINSILRYFDTDSLKDQFISGGLIRRLHQLISGYDKVMGITIDEVSMMEAAQLQMIYDAFRTAVQYSDVEGEYHLTLTGDFAQLPPVQGKFAFEADCWPEFEKNTQRLTKVWRQTNPLFLQALDSFRQGKGKDGVELLKQCGVKFHGQTCKFAGTTIVPVNDMVDRFNQLQFMEINSPVISVPVRRQGQQLSEWRDPRIPDSLQLKVGALVMVLANDTECGLYANGDLGIVKEWDADNHEFVVNLFRSGVDVNIGYITRVFNDYVETPDGKKKKQQVGAVTFIPLRLAYAATVHKSQGLTMDRLQVDIRHRFFSNPSSMYVALSRCRTPEGLRIVGTEELMIKRTVSNPKVGRFL